MHRDNDRYKLFTRRAAMLAGGKALLLSTLLGRMYYLQVVEADRYRTLADENRINIRLLSPPRGRIMDRFGRLLAVNRQNYRVVVVSDEVPGRNVEAILDSLSKVVRLTEGERKRILREIGRKRAFVPVTVRENLSWEEVARIAVNTPDLPGVAIDVGQSRFYPQGEDAAHVLGYVAAVSEQDLTGDPLLELPGFRIGKAGIEKVHDLALRGGGGTSRVEVNALGRVIRELERQDGLPGADVWLTIDKGLQNMAARAFGEESGAAVVLDIHTGEVLALVSTPSFDPNAFNSGLSSEDWNTLIGSPKAPLTNKAIAGQYAPGSTFKMVTMLAALERGVITPQQRVYCPGHMELGNARFHCWKKEGHGAVDAHSAMVQSCDVYFYEIARRTGVERIAAMARRLGLGNELGIDMPGERKGLIPDRNWKRAALNQSWHQGETLIVGIGQGYVLTTPLQLAVMTASLVNGGFAVTPRITRAVTTAGGTVIYESPLGKSLGISQSHLALVRDSMSAVVNTPQGTAFRSAFPPSMGEVAMGGKTGTSQVRRISKSERDVGVIRNEDLPWEQRDHALFVGFAPVDAPRYAVAVLVEHGGSGSRAAAPIARDILIEALQRNSGGTPKDATEMAAAPSPSAGTGGAP